MGERSSTASLGRRAYREQSKTPEKVGSDRSELKGGLEPEGGYKDSYRTLGDLK